MISQLLTLTFLISPLIYTMPAIATINPAPAPSAIPAFYNNPNYPRYTGETNHPQYGIVFSLSQGRALSGLSKEEATLINQQKIENDATWRQDFRIPNVDRYGRLLEDSRDDTTVRSVASVPNQIDAIWNEGLDFAHDEDTDFWDGKDFSDIIKEDLENKRRAKMDRKYLMEFARYRIKDVSSSEREMETKFIDLMLADEEVKKCLARIRNIIFSWKVNMPVLNTGEPWGNLVKSMGKILEEFGTDRDDKLSGITEKIRGIFRVFDKYFKFVRKEVDGEWRCDEQDIGMLAPVEKMMRTEYLNAKTYLSLAILNRVLSYRESLFNVPNAAETQY